MTKPARAIQSYEEGRGGGIVRGANEGI